MKATDLIERLRHLVKQHGDMNIIIDVWMPGLNEVDEVDVDTEDSGIMIWGKPVDED